MADLKSALTRLYPPLPKCPPNYHYASIAELYQNYEARLEGSCVTDPLGREIYFLAENFPHLVKLEFFNKKTKVWVSAVAKIAMPQLKDKKLDESSYRICDPSRPRTLFWASELIQSPDVIYDNKRNNGTEIYVKRYSRTEGATIKVALVATRSDGTRVIVTSFWSDDAYVVKNCMTATPKHGAIK